MPITIFRKESNSVEEWLVVNDDGSLTYHFESSGWAMKGGLHPVDKSITPTAAKERWPAYASAIDSALNQSGK